MKRIVINAISLLLLIAPIPAICQSASELGLRLEGKAERCSEPEREKQDVDCYKLRMTFENKGSVPVIIINPSLAYGTGLKEIIYHFDYNSYELRKGFVHHVVDVPKPLESDANKVANFKEMAQFFGGDRPPENMTIILQPTDSFTFEESFEVQKVFRYSSWVNIRSQKDNVTGRDINSIETSTQREWPSSFKMVYEFSFLPYVADPDLLEKMSRRWRRFGRLPVGTNGTYTVTSEPIK